MPIDVLAYEHLMCAQSGDTDFFFFLGFQSLLQSLLAYSAWVKRLRIGGQSDKDDLIVEVCEDCFRVVEKVEIKEVK